MDLIRISDSKLKVMLSVDDMAHYGITCEAINYENTETRRAIWEILDEAKQKTGFDAASDRIFIQVYPSRDGGCELYITKIGGGEVPGVGGGTALSPMRMGRCAYRFCRLEDLLTVCAILLHRRYDGESAAYADGSGYYLIVSEQIPSGKGGLRPYGFIEEYGERLQGQARVAYIEEYADPLSRAGAVEQLGPLR